MIKKHGTKEIIVSNIPNVITMVRVILAPLLILVPVLSLPFFIIYSVCGLSDALDGFSARALRCTSERGALLDSIADLTFYSILAIRLIPYLYSRVISLVWYLFASVVFIRLCAYLTAFVKYKRFASLHTYGNKATGAAVFSMPYALLVFDDFAVCITALVIAAISSTEELIIYIRSKTYPKGLKSIILK